LRFRLYKRRKEKIELKTIQKIVFSKYENSENKKALTTKAVKA
jgi:hypothetical protein